LGLTLAVINPDRTIARSSGPEMKPKQQTKAVQKPAATSKKPVSSGFKIIDDEGC